MSINVVLVYVCAIQPTRWCRWCAVHIVFVLQHVILRGVLVLTTEQSIIEAPVHGQVLCSRAKNGEYWEIHTARGLGHNKTVREHGTHLGIFIYDTNPVVFY